MATITVSALTKMIGDRTLFEDVSFKLERRDRMTLSGRNGSGKTTLLRILTGEAGKDGGAISFGKGVRVALHDQRPPRGDATLGEYVIGGLGWIAEIEAELAAIEARMADGDTGEATLDALRRRPVALRPRRRLPLARRGAGDGPRPRLRRLGARPAALGVLGRRADPRLARPRPRLEARPPAPRRADQPPRHRVARVARALPDGARRGGDPRRARPLVPRVGRDLGARARGRPGAVLRRPVARVARRARRARARRRSRRRAPPGRDRAHGAVRRAVPLQGDEGPPGAVEAEGDRAGQGRRRRAGPARSSARSRSSSAPPSARDASSSSSRTRGSRSATEPCSRAASCGSSARST